MAAVDYEKLTESRRGESLDTVRERGMKVRLKQNQRFEESYTNSNSGMSRLELETKTKPSEASKKLLENAMSRMGLSARTYDGILKVARTITDLEGADSIQTPHVAEAIQYCNLDSPV